MIYKKQTALMKMDAQTINKVSKHKKLRGFVNFTKRPKGKTKEDVEYIGQGNRFLDYVQWLKLQIDDK